MIVISSPGVFPTNWWSVAAEEGAMKGALCPLATGLSIVCRFGGALLGSNGSSSSGGLFIETSATATGDRLESMV